MAIFQGEETVDVTTPDGRTLTLPRSIVPASVLTQIAAPQAGAPAGGAPIGIPAQQPEMPVPTLPRPEAAPGIVEMGEPTVQSTAGTGVVEMGEPTIKTGVQLAKEQKAQAAYNATPKGQLAAVQGQQNAAAGAEANAIVGAADVEAAEQAVVADAVTERNKQLDGLFAKRAADAQKNADAEEAKMGQVETLRKKIAGTKIDRTADHPILAAIMAGLAGLGSAMKGEKVDTLNILYTAIDRKVAAQTADLDQLGKVYGMTKDELSMLKDRSKSRLEFHNALIAGETDKAIRHIEEITARTASDKTRANAKLMIAQLQTRAADKTMEATRWGLDFDQKDKHQKAQIGLGYANLAESKRSNMAGEQLKREGMYFDYQQALAAQKAKGDEIAFKALMEGEKDVSQRGLKGIDGYLLTPAGRQKMTDAAKLEADAQALESDPDVMARSVAKDKIALMRQKAAVLRGEANVSDVVKARSDTQAGEMSKKAAATQAMLDNIDEINMLYDKIGRNYISKDAGAMEIQSKIEQLNLQLKEVTGSGAWDKGLAQLYRGITGGDPTSGWDVGVVGAIMKQQMIKDPEGFKKQLESVALNASRGVTLEIQRNSQWDGKGELFTRKKAGSFNTPVDKASQKLSQARSGVELEKNAGEAGIVAKVGRGAFYPLSPTHAEEADAAQSLKYLGLSRAQEPQFDTLLKAYKSGDKAAEEQLVGMAAAASESRPDLAGPILRNLREHAPKLYPAARAALPKGGEVDKQMDFEETSRVGTGMQETGVLANIVLSTVDASGKVGDEEGYRELARRAGQKDPVARKAILEIVKRSSDNKALPKGSVFRGTK